MTSASQTNQRKHPPHAPAHACVEAGTVLFLLLTLALPACTTPPSVTPLLRLTHEALHAEAQRLAADTARDRAHLDAVRRSLAAGYDADLAQRDAITADWARDAAEAYAAAREALVRHELALRHERELRADNLAAAAEATERAIALLEQQDALITGATRMNAWRLLRKPIVFTPPQETQP